MEGKKLLILGIAPAADVKNIVWDQIKLIDASNSDLICDLTVSQTQQAMPAMTAAAAASGGQNRRRYTVKPGDTLSKISREF